ncbi:uncharacterized protein ARMOST_20851 [Armillaria ostoyae]|uniref:Uncharacterized protein n=1 Tax=Armillaria ostoyae TaxID=47428 RepID=A0A284S8G3_ARMOS|nr:uncharacterized protein ARMOST_20851 [Armillaria ostoyae]
MAEPTDPVALTALTAYDGTSHALSELQDHLPDVDEEGAVDAWVTKAQMEWKIAAENWEVAGVTDRAWHQVERSFMKILPEVHKKSLQAVFVEYNELVECAMEFDFDVVPLAIPKTHKQRGTSSSQRAGSHVAASPAPSHQKSLVPLANLSHQSTPTSQTPKPPVLPVDLPRPVSPMLVPPKSASPPMTPSPTKLSSVAPSSLKCAVSSHTSDLTVEVPKLNYSTATSPHISSSSEKTQTKLMMFLKPKPPPPPAYAAFTGLQVPAGGNNSSPSGGYVFFPPDQTSSLHYRQGHPFKIGPSTNDMRTEKPTCPTLSPLCIVDAATCPVLLPGPDSAHHEGSIPSPPSFCQPLFYLGTDDEEEQSHGVMANEECIEGSDDEDGVFQGQEYSAPTPPLNDPIDVNQEPTQQSDDAPSLPPTKPRACSSQDQAPHHSTRPHISPVDQDATYLKMTQGSKSSGIKKDKKNHTESSGKKDAKGKEKEASSLKCSQDDDNGALAVDKPAAKKLKAAVTKVDEAEVVCAIPAF